MYYQLKKYIKVAILHNLIVMIKTCMTPVVAAMTCDS